ncbi:acyl-CoA dehydrogenase family protein [Williamsia soli]|uniref:acyl-CoA dehydrogenase family protein n=1 Tax=Williamsia soli TaxID=364929 RepID=UPI001A9DE623|nr:acyl-CoA dehydrogenase family protein [Williamsia soli]
MYIPIPMNDEHVAMDDTIRHLLARSVALEDVRGVLDLGADGLRNTTVWKQASAIGLPGITIPEQYGGMGGTPLDMFVGFRAWGKVVHPSPLFSSIALAAPALVQAGSVAARKEHLPGIASGEVLAALAAYEDSAGWDLDRITTTATPSQDGAYLLTGRKLQVLDLTGADVVLVVARADFGIGLFAADRDDPGFTDEPLTSFDLTRSLSHLELNRVPARLVSDEHDCAPQLREALREAELCLVADCIGGAEAALDMAISYAKVREQFGRPIGGFQSIKHKLADLAVTVEGMISSGWTAAEEAEAGGKTAYDDLLLAKIYCTDAYYRVARANIHVHGGIGFTWEHPAHLYFRRAVANSMLLGDEDVDRSTLFARLVSRQAGEGA